MNSGRIRVTLPTGLWFEGKHHQSADLRPLTGADEAWLWEHESASLPAYQTTALLAQSLIRLGPLESISTEAIRTLTVGDREALLLHLRRLTIGERLQCVLSCPDAGCGEKLDIELQVSDLILPPYAQPQAWHETSVRAHRTAYHVRFRLPTGADQEDAARLARSDPHAAATHILRRCVACVTTEREGDVPIEAWPSTLGQQLPAVMSDLDPQAELQLNLSCPVCSRHFSTYFDTASYFFQELASRVENLYREVHQLALSYHWSEAEIMGMTTQKRHRYLRLLFETLSVGGRG